MIDGTKIIIINIIKSFSRLKQVYGHTEIISMKHELNSLKSIITLWRIFTRATAELQKYGAKCEIFINVIISYKILFKTFTFTMLTEIES